MLIAAPTLPLTCGHRAGDGRIVRPPAVVPAPAPAHSLLAPIRRLNDVAACAQLSVDTRKKLEQDEQKPCRDAIGQAQIKPAALAAIEVFSTNAKADLANGDSAFLSLTTQGWRLSAVGCKPAGGPPSDVPMDCELEG